VNFIVSTSGTDCLERLICEMTCYVFITYLLIYYTTCYSLGQQINSVDYLAISVDRSYGLRQGGYVFVLVCLYVGLPDRRITMDEFSRKVWKSKTLDKNYSWLGFGTVRCESQEFLQFSLSLQFAVSSTTPRWMFARLCSLQFYAFVTKCVNVLVIQSDSVVNTEAVMYIYSKLIFYPDTKFCQPWQRLLIFTARY